MKSKIKMIGLIVFVSLLGACTSSSESKVENNQPLSPDAEFCSRQGGEYIDGAYPTCYLSDGNELNSWDFYQERNH